MTKAKVYSAKKRIEAVHRILYVQEAAIIEFNQKSVDLIESEKFTIDGLIYQNISMRHKLRKVLDTLEEVIDENESS